MKHVLKFGVIGLLALVITCCTKNDNDEVNNLIGVWEYVEEVDDKTTTFQLVLGKENTGFEINKVALKTGEITSSVTEIRWEVSGNKIEVTGTLKKVYRLNGENQLVLVTAEHVILTKILNDYSKFY